MAKRKQSHRTPQLQHDPRSSGSRHDRRSRLAKRDQRRGRTTAAKVPLIGELAADYSICTSITPESICCRAVRKIASRKLLSFAEPRSPSGNRLKIWSAFLGR